MKTLLSVLLVLAIVSPICAETVLFQENFEEAGAGNPGVSISSLPGWTGNATPYLSDWTSLDGNTAEWNRKPSGWVVIGRPFTNTPSAGDTYTLTATLFTPNVTGSNSSVWLSSSMSETYQVGISMGQNYFDWFSYYPGGSKKITGTATHDPVDVKIALTADEAVFSYRAQGATTWIPAGSLATGYALSTYQAVTMDVNCEYTGAIDSINLTSSPVPEPSALILLTGGLLGLLAYAWKKRR